MAQQIARPVRALRNSLSLLLMMSCISGASQAQENCSAPEFHSPIDISDTQPVRTHALHPQYGLSAFHMMNQPGGLAMPYEQGHLLRVAGKAFQLTEITFKTPSDHRVLGNSFPLEIQLHHRAANGMAATLSVLVSEGEENRALGELLSQMPLEKGQENMRETLLFNARDLLPYDLPYYRYQGSDTEGACRTPRAWYIVKNTATASKAQLDAITTIQGTNNAALAERGHRLILDTAQ